MVMLISGHCSAGWVSVAGGWWLGWNTCPSPNLVITPWLTACSGVVAALAYLTPLTHYKNLSLLLQIFICLSFSCQVCYFPLPVPKVPPKVGAPGMVGVGVGGRCPSSHLGPVQLHLRLPHPHTAAVVSMMRQHDTTGCWPPATSHQPPRGHIATL